jgi:hypothetical protein
MVGGRIVYDRNGSAEIKRLGRSPVANPTKFDLVNQSRDREGARGTGGDIRTSFDRKLPWRRA